MTPYRLAPLALSTTLLAGCLSATKPAVLPAPAAVAEAAKAIPAPDDPVRPQLADKFQAFLTGRGLAAAPAKPGEAAMLTVGWDNKVWYAPDTTRGGDPVPGLIARLWVFGPDEAVPLEPDGELIVGLWDLGTQGPDGRPALQELWHIDRETARQFRKRDAIGDGYTLFVPWSKYHVDLKQVNVMVRYNGADGRSVASAPQRLTLDHSATLQRAAEKLGLKPDADRAAGLPAPSPIPAPLPAAVK